MTEDYGILSDLYTADQALETFAQQTHKWRRLSERLFDIKEALESGELTFASWQGKFDIQAHRPDLHMRILFGKEGNERIRATLESINVMTRMLKSDVDRIVSQSFKIKTAKSGFEIRDNANEEELMRECLRKIQRNTSWSRKFVISILSKLDDLETRIERLHRKLTMLERYSEFFLEKEHPDIFSRIKRIPGPKYLREETTDTVPKKVIDALRARRDAEILHRASGNKMQTHIGLSVPSLDRRDFAFLLSLNNQTHEILVQPVKIKSTTDPTLIPLDLATAVSNLTTQPYSKSYMLPSPTSSAGFQISPPKTPTLINLQYKSPLSNILQVNTNNNNNSPPLYPHDQSVLASSIAKSSFRLLGSPWLNYMHSTNIRWRKSTLTNQWTSMLSATPKNDSITRALAKYTCIQSQIFRIGIVLAELVLQVSLQDVDIDAKSGTVRFYVYGGEEVGVQEVAAMVEAGSNVLVGDMVGFCLGALGWGDEGVEERYLVGVVRRAEELDGLGRVAYAEE